MMRGGRGPIKLATPKLMQALAALYADLGWNAARQQGFNQRTCGHPRPRTTAEANKIYQGLEEILKRLFKPYYPQFQALVKTLYAERWRMTPWERDIFLPDIWRKITRRDCGVFSPAMVKKVREIAHKYGVNTGFPSFQELAAHYDQIQQTTGDKHYATNRH